jgi:hypothetical protein
MQLTCLLARLGVECNAGLCSRVDKSKALAMVLHCCDIAHPAKRWDLHRRWTELLLEEFFRQGDREQELGLPFSPLCDRNNTLVAESQIGAAHDSTWQWIWRRWMCSPSLSILQVS